MSRSLGPWLMLLLAVAVMASGLTAQSAKATPNEDRATPPGSSVGRGADFDGDGDADLAAGSPRALYVLYGSPTGLQNDNRPRWSMSDLVEKSRDHPDRLFGPSTTGDYNGDGFSDLALWLPKCCNERPVNYLCVIYGSATGLTLAGRTVRKLDINEEFPALTSGNFGRGRFADLAVGHGSADVSGVIYAGAVHVLYGATDGLATSKVETWTQNSPGVVGVAKSNDFFGTALAAGPFAGRDLDDLAIGVPGDDQTEDGDSSGSVQVLHGSKRGLTAAGNQLLKGDTAGLRTTRWGTEGFGGSLAAGFFAGRRYADLAVGSGTQVAFDPKPDEIPEGDHNGAVHVLYGSSQGLTVAGNQLWRANTDGIKGKAGADAFGSSLAAGNLGKDRDGSVADDLIIAAPDNHDYRGAVHVLYGSRNGLTSRGDQLWRQSSPGIPGGAEGGDRFGAHVVAADFGNNPSGQRYADLAVSSTSESLDGVGDAGTVHVLSGSAEGLQSRNAQGWREDHLGGRLFDYGNISFGGFGALLAGR